MASAHASTRWEIRLHDQPPLYVTTDAPLDETWAAHRAKRKRRVSDHTWHVAPGTALDGRVVLAVHRVLPKVRPAPGGVITGFHAPG